MLATVVIVGRPNVGKSTLFNALTRTRDALVADQPGLTRDRKMGLGEFDGRHYWLIDTGGVVNGEEGIQALITQQVTLAIQEADIVLLLVDGRVGLTVMDQEIAEWLRRFQKPICLVINKTEGLSVEVVSCEFYGLGFEKMCCIASGHRQGLEVLLNQALSSFPEDDESGESSESRIAVAIVGRPNVGKSTLVNRILGYERVIAADQPGTTRDSIAVPFERDGRLYTLIDTAGIRRRSRVFEVIEKFSVIKSLQSIEMAQVVVVLLDAQEGMTDQDAHLLGLVLESGRALVIAVNKWDGLSMEQRRKVHQDLDRKLHFLDFARIHFISALHGTEVGNLFRSIDEAWEATTRQISTSYLNEMLSEALELHPPPAVMGRRIKLRYIHQGGHRPPLFVIHGNQVEALPESYKRYLINGLRNKLGLYGTPIRLEFKQGENPFQGRKNELTERQQKKRQRLIRYVKK